MEPFAVVGGSFEHSLRDPLGKIMLGWLLAPMRVPCTPGVLESYLQGQGSLAAPKAPLGQEPLGIHAVLAAQTVPAVLTVLGSLADL